MAREVITKGEATLDQQNTTGLSMLNANSVRRRILSARDWLEKTLEPAAPKKGHREAPQALSRRLFGIGYQVSVCSLVGRSI